jgi:hypothetical protein
MRVGEVARAANISAALSSDAERSGGVGAKREKNGGPLDAAYTRASLPSWACEP